jgi:hypothetical protein
MTFPLLAASLLGAFYTFLVVAVVLRTTKPSCRICVSGITAASAHNWAPGPEVERCLANKSRL